jgi:hypothetical protein
LLQQLCNSFKQGIFFGILERPIGEIFFFFFSVHVVFHRQYSPIMSEMEQELDQNKATASHKEQTTTAEKRNACESGLDPKVLCEDTDFDLS